MGVIIIAITLLLAAVFLFPLPLRAMSKQLSIFIKILCPKTLTTVEENAFLDLKWLAKNNPQQLLDLEQLEKINAPSIEIVVRKDHQIVYSTQKEHKQLLLQSLPGFEATNINSRDTIMINQAFYTYVKFDFYFPNQTEGSIFVLREVSSHAEVTRELLPILLGILFVLFMMIIGFKLFSLKKYY